MEEAVKICLAYKNDSAVIRVSVPVIIISLEEGKCFGEMLNLFVPLPRLKPCGMYVQGAKADETNDNLTCNVYEGLRRLKKTWHSNQFHPLGLGEGEKRS